MIDYTNRMGYVIEQIQAKNELHGKKITRNVSKFGEDYFQRANDFLKQYEILLQNDGKQLDYSIDCYLQMILDVNYESVQFFKTGEYTSKSFEEVNQRVYNNPGVMEYYMHGLVLSQFLWTQHYDILLRFNEIIAANQSGINRYLEVGGGHGLYISEAIKLIGNQASYDLVDISESSIKIAKKMIKSDIVNYIHTDIYKYFPEYKYDFITMGEVMEHVEDPVSLLKKLHTLLNDNGKLFVTTPTNAPAIDHIYLFKNADDIRDVITSAGFKIESELCIYAEDMPAEKAERLKISMMYAGLLTK